MPYKFLQPVSTPRGHGLFIGKLVGEEKCIVAITSGTKPNLIFSIDQVHALEETKKPVRAKMEAVSVLQVDTSL